MDLEKIERLLDIIARSGMAEVELEEDDFRIVVRAVAPAGAAPTMMAMPSMAMPGFSGYPAQPPTPSAPDTSAPGVGAEAAAPAKSANDIVVQAPIVGTYYTAPAPDADPFVKVGDRVAPGDVLCIIEAMKLMNEIQSEHAGVVKQMLVQNAEPVEYDQPLFVIEKA